MNLTKLANVMATTDATLPTTISYGDRKAIMEHVAFAYLSPLMANKSNDTVSNLSRKVAGEYVDVERTHTTNDLTIHYIETKKNGMCDVYAFDDKPHATGLLLKVRVDVSEVICDWIAGQVDNNNLANRWEISMVDPLYVGKEYV